MSIVINALDNDPSTAIAMNFEATGYEYEDELLQLSIINFKGNILFNSYFKPKKHKEWTETEKENGITPEMVANAPQISEMAKQIAEIFNKADLILYSKNYSYYWLFSWSNILIQPEYRREVNVNEMITESDNFELPKDYNVPLVKTQMKKIIVTAKTLYSHPKNVSKIYAALHTDLAW